MKAYIAGFLVVASSGCANVDFNANNDGAVYYEPLPYLFYSVTDKCIRSVTVVALPGKKRHLDFTSGIGSSNLSAEFSGGLLTKVGQTSDTKIPETLTSIGSLLSPASGQGCKVEAVLIPIENGKPNKSGAFNLID